MRKKLIWRIFIECPGVKGVIKLCVHAEKIKRVDTHTLQIDSHLFTSEHPIKGFGLD